MGGMPGRIRCFPLGEGAVLREQFEQFHVAGATCAKYEDKTRLLTAIENVFGNHDVFDQFVRSLLTSALSSSIST